MNTNFNRNQVIKPNIAKKKALLKENINCDGIINGLVNKQHYTQKISFIAFCRACTKLGKKTT